MIWVIGDIHGMFDPLKALITRIEKKEFLLRKVYDTYAKYTNLEKYPFMGIVPTPIKLIFIGDYIDFGPSSKEVIDYILNLNHDKVFLLGNHEDMLLQFHANSSIMGEIGYMWFRNGGLKTLDSFDDQKKMFDIYSQNPQAIPLNINFESKDIKIHQRYWDFFNDLEITHSEEFDLGHKKIKFHFTHAGLYVPDRIRSMSSILKEDSTLMETFKNIIERQLNIKTYEDYLKYLIKEHVFFDDSVLWQRKEHTARYGDFIVIHGHTPTYLLPGYFKNIGNYGDSGGKYVNLPYFMFEKKDVTISQRENYYNDSKYIYKCSLDNLIEINIDTGCVYGKRLTAIGLTKELLNTNRFEIIQVNMAKSHRLDEDVINSFTIEVNDKFKEE